jgi:uncharacterized protein with LGFP repeats/L,D-peptidoglycan transpeptidase YkuD (ErfK/YbiS/YcfS/YnhG family)
MFKSRLLNSSLMLVALAACSLVFVAPAEAGSQVYDPCQRLSQGQTKYSSYGANRVTFATAVDRNTSAVTITGCVRSGAGYAQEWQDWGYAGSAGFAAPGLTWEDSFRSPTGSYSVTEALGRSNPGTRLFYRTVNANSRWGGEHNGNYNQYFEGTGGPSDENLFTYMNQGYYEQAAVINYNRHPDMPTTIGASFAIFFHAGRVPSAGCLSTSLGVVNRFLNSANPGDRIIMGAVDDVFTPYRSSPFGAINAKYAATGGPAGLLGSPTGEETGGLTNGGASQSFQGGAIVWSPSSAARVSTGSIRSRWLNLDGERGFLGYPTTDEIQGAKGGVYQMYQGGAVNWSSATGAYATGGAIRGAWAAQGFESGPLGLPVSGETGGLTGGGVYQMFQGGAVNWSQATGAHATGGAIRTAWGAQGFEKGLLGYPTTGEVRGIRNGGVYQMFQGGAMNWSPATGAHATKGAIRAKWAEAGYENGRLGYPTSDETPSGAGVFQTFQGGVLHWSPSTGARITADGILSAWAAQGMERGTLGYPTTDEVKSAGGAMQTFQGGSILWSPATGAKSVIGDLNARFLLAGGTASLGYPTSEQAAARDGGALQIFERGTLVRTPTKTVILVSAKILAAWNAFGAEGGKLGYPNAEERPASAGREQHFENGSIVVGADGQALVNVATP